MKINIYFKVTQRSYQNEVVEVQEHVCAIDVSSLESLTLITNIIM